MGWSSCAHKQKIEACRLYLKIVRTPENRLINKIFKWSSTHGKSWERRLLSYMSENNLETYLNDTDLSVKKLSKAYCNGIKKL